VTPRRRQALAAVALTAVLALAPLVVWGASYTVRSEVDATRVGVEDQLQLTITVEGTGGPEAVALPALSNLAAVGGPFQSTQVSIVNGRMTQSRSWTWALQPQAEGTAEVGPVTAGEETAPAITIEVVAGSVRPQQPQRRLDPFGRDPFGSDPFEELLGRRRRPRAEPKVLMRAIPSRQSIRVGEPLLLTYYLYTQVQPTDLQWKDGPPQYTGFWVEDLERPKAPTSGEAATVAGERYRRFPLIQKLLFPTKAGNLTIPATTFIVRLAPRGFFDQGQAVERSTEAVAVTVEPLPDVPGFSGAVGSFQAEASLDRDTVPLGEAALLRLRLEGTGNLKWIDRPPEVEVSGAKVYPPQAKSDLKVTSQGMRGSRTWEFVVVPETSGTLEVPAVAFPYFDPKAEAVVTTDTRPLSLHVEGGTMAAGAPAPPSATIGDGSALPLRADLDAAAVAVPSLGGRTVAALAVLFLLAHAGLWGAGFMRGAFRRVGGRTTPARSVRAALRDIQRAGRPGMTKEQAAALIDKGLHEAFGDVDDDGSERARALRALLSEVHFVRYAPQLGDYSETLRDLAGRAAEAVKRWA
jgi:hypothetical protein